MDRDKRSIQAATSLVTREIAFRDRLCEKLPKNLAKKEVVRDCDLPIGIAAVSSELSIWNLSA